MCPNVLARALACVLVLSACSDRLSDPTGPFDILTHEQGAPAPSDRYEALAVGDVTACGITTEGDLNCWSRGSGPERVSSGQEFSTIDAIFAHLCGLADDGEAWCLGDNSGGQLGDGTTTDRDSLTRVAGDHEFVDIAAGDRFTCALDEGGDAWCWGRGSLVVGEDGQTSEPVRITEGRSFTSIEAGSSHACALEGDETWCWGENGFGQLGDGTTDGSSEPVAVTGGHTFASIGAGGSYTCGLEEDGDAFCWGHNELTLELGIDEDGTDFVTEPTAVAGELTFASLSTGYIHACALEGDGDAFCWGEGDTGALGNGGDAAIGRPTAVSGGHTFAVVEAGRHSTCAIDEDGAVWCWGLIESDGDPLVPTRLEGDGDPGEPPSAEAVTDLEVVRRTSSTIRLRWTQVDNGVGDPAWYRVKYAETPLEDWKDATIGCRRTIRGNDIGDEIRCTVSGLDPDTRYDFQLMSFRVEDGRWVGAVFSNVATGETRARGGSGASRSGAM